MEQDIQVIGLTETLRALSRLPKEAQRSLRERTQAVAGVLAGKVQAAARASDAQSAMVAQTVRARKDRMPTLSAGGAKRVGRNRTPAHKVFFGAEFGSGGRLPQFRPHLGREGYWLYPTVRGETDEQARLWQDVLDDVAAEWARGDAGGVS